MLTFLAVVATICNIINIVKIYVESDYDNGLLLCYLNGVILPFLIYSLIK